MVSLEARFWTYSNSTTAQVYSGLHFLNVHLAGKFGVMTYEEMEMIMVKPNARKRGTNMAS